ncbi:hypothetical protein ASD54_03480 [Rhizobium sp. Root149]|nr:hypothetical protein ASD54_03480 [Rhizobium sp. Root149]
MSKWTQTTIGQVLLSDGGSIKTGPFGTTLKAAEYSDTGVPLISVREIGYGHFRVDEKTPRIGKQILNRLPEYVLEKGDIVFGRKGAVDRAALVTDAQIGWFLGSDGIRLRLPRTCDPSFVRYWISTPLIRVWLHQHSTGSTMPSLNQNTIARIPLNLPSLSEQHAISSHLSSLDDKIELNRRMNETLEAMAQAVFRDWFVDFGPTRRKLEGATDPLTIMGGLVQDTERAQALADLFPAALGDDGLPEGWRETSLGAVAKATGGIVQTGPFGSQLHQSDYLSAGLPVVMPANLTYSGFRHGDFSYVSLETTERLSKHRLKTGDIVYGRRGDIGRKALIGKYNEGWLCGTGCLKISFPAKPIPAEYLFYSLDHQNTLDWIRARAIGATMPNLNTSTLAEMPLLYPSDALLAVFEQMVKPMLTLREENDQQNGTLAATRDLLLPKLMSGEIRLPEAEDLMEAAP